MKLKPMNYELVKEIWFKDYNDNDTMCGIVI
jgi:hypothetical protein